jgi:hypothetical protein
MYTAADGMQVSIIGELTLEIGLESYSLQEILFFPTIFFVISR